MAYEQRPNSGTLFPNKSKPKPMSPDYSGTIMLDVNSLKVENGVATVRLAGWKKQGKNGTFLSLAASAPMDRAQEGRGSAPTNLADIEDDAPF